MKERIREILKNEKLTSAQFADKIGVQRSSISHILSGRNKPGFDFIQKILSNFPEIDADWLITGNGGIYKKRAQPSGLFENSENIRKKNDLDDNKNKDNMIFNERSIPEVAKKGADRKIEKILVFYSDKTFREYEPEI